MSSRMIKTRCSSFELIEPSIVQASINGYYYLLNCNLSVIYRYNEISDIVINKKNKQINFISLFGNNTTVNYCIYERSMNEMEFQQIGDWICKVPSLAGLMTKMNGDALIAIYGLLSKMLLKDIAGVIVTLIMDIFRYDVNHYVTFTI